MAVRLAINGFGRIGRMILRAMLESGRKDIMIAAINDLADAKMAAHLLRYDSVHGRAGFDIAVQDGMLVCGGQKIALTGEREPDKCPWSAHKIDVVLECTGLFTAREQAERHLAAGAKRVLISAPAGDPDITVVYGVNHRALRPEHKIVSNASCTTNCLAPVAQVLDSLAGIHRAHMTTIHAFTSDQNLHDALHKDLRRARAAPLSMIPTSTGAAKAIGLVLPHLAGKISGCAVRVPVPNVSLVDFIAETQKPVSAQAVERAFRDAAAGNALAGILGIADAPVVSSDINHSAYSSVFDPAETHITDGQLVRVLSWYDNEWGFANRMGDVAAAMGR